MDVRQEGICAKTQLLLKRHNHLGAYCKFFGRDVPSGAGYNLYGQEKGFRMFVAAKGEHFSGATKIHWFYKQGGKCRDL